MTDNPLENDSQRQDVDPADDSSTGDDNDGAARAEPFDDTAVDFGDLGAVPEDTESQPPVEETLDMKLEAATNRILRMQAELENVRKRTAREMDIQRRYAAMPLLRDLLPALDNMYRAIEAAEKSEDSSDILEGFKMVVTLMTDALARHHCAPIEALHRPFDPHLHEAVQQLPNSEYPSGTVLIELQTGYLLHDRIVRPSQVIVSTAPPEPETTE